MKEKSEITIKDIWPSLCEFGMVELRINSKTVWSDFALDALANKDYYEEAINEYFNCAEEYIEEWYKNFRVIEINIKIVDFHHCIVSINGYFENIEEEIK